MPVPAPPLADDTLAIVPPDPADDGTDAFLPAVTGRPAPTLPAMSRSLIERRLTEVASRLVEARRELTVADEQLAVLDDMADDARLRALVSETPLAGQDHRETSRHAEAMRRHRADIATEIAELERQQDELLDRMVAEG